MSAENHWRRMNRRKMLGTTTALIGGAIASAGGSAFAQEKPSAAAGAAPATGPNLAPPVVQVKGGKLRGLSEGKTSSFLGIPYAEAGRFELPKPAAAWTGVKNAQAWGPVCPSPEQTTVSSDELVFPHRYWIENENCQYLNVWTQNLTPPRRRSRSWSGCMAAGSRTARRWSRTRMMAAASASSATSSSSASITG